MLTCISSATITPNSCLHSASRSSSLGSNSGSDEAEYSPNPDNNTTICCADKPTTNGFKSRLLSSVPESQPVSENRKLKFSTDDSFTFKSFNGPDASGSGDAAKAIYCNGLENAKQTLKTPENVGKPSEVSVERKTECESCLFDDLVVNFRNQSVTVISHRTWMCLFDENYQKSGSEVLQKIIEALEHRKMMLLKETFLSPDCKQNGCHEENIGRSPETNQFNALLNESLHIIRKCNSEPNLGKTERCRSAELHSCGLNESSCATEPSTTKQLFVKSEIVDVDDSFDSKSSEGNELEQSAALEQKPTVSASYSKSIAPSVISTTSSNNTTANSQTSSKWLRSDSISPVSKGGIETYPYTQKSQVIAYCRNLEVPVYSMFYLRYCIFTLVRHKMMVKRHDSPF